MKKFRTWYNDKIEEIEVIRETERFVVVHAGLSRERREARSSDNGSNYFDTYQEAKEFLIDREKDAIQGHQNDIKRHQETLQKIKDMKQ
jgi:vacuolar-type H+-ATPase catalytic subunit A/Vma1